MIKIQEQLTLTKDERISEKKRIIQLVNDFIESNKEIVRPVVDNQLLDKLKDYRLEKSIKKSIPYYCVLPNETLNLISTIYQKIYLNYQILKVLEKIN